MFGGGGGGFFGGGGMGVPMPTTFEEQYRVYPVVMADKAHLEDGDKILMPPSALETLARLRIDYPMLFKISNVGKQRHTHCGVLEFSAPEGCCYMPYWMMQNLLLEDGGIVSVVNKTLSKACFVKIQPLSEKFLEIQNPRAVLEHQLRSFSCVTVGDQLRIGYLEDNYYLQVIEVKSREGGGGPVACEAACIIETDMEVDFAPPPGYEEKMAAQQAEKAAAAAAAAASASSAAYGGAKPPPDADVAGADEAAAADPEKAKAQYWSSLSGQRLDGKGGKLAASPSPAASGGSGAVAGSAGSASPMAAAGASIKRVSRKPRQPRQPRGAGARKNYEAFSGGGRTLGGS